MKNPLYLFCALLLTMVIASCNSPSGESRNIELINKFEQALKDVDSETMNLLLADNFVGYGPSIKDSVGKDDFLLLWQHNMEQLYQNFEFKNSEHIEVARMKDGEKQTWVSNWGRLFIKYRDHGNETEIWSNTVYLIEEGKIEKIIIFYNEADALRQAGFHYIFKEPVRLDN